jgi:hypothetical protein
LPVITTDGTPQTGETITTTDGTWTGAAPITFTYQWQRNGVNIAAATAKTYVLVVADEGQSLRVNVTATNTGGNLMRSANPITPTSAIAPPVNTTAPVVSGTATVGSTLTTTDGVWTGPTPTYTYKWQRDGADIGATANTYVLVGLDGGHNVRCVVTATNSAGFASANSNAIAVAAPPSLQSEIMADGPYAYWRGGGYTPGGIGTALADSSGNARALHLWNDAQVPESAYPKPGASLIPSAAGDPSIDFLVNSNFWNPDNWPSISGSWTISLWCKPRSGALANFTWHDIARNNGMGVLINYSSPNYVFEARQVRGGSTYSIISAPVVVNTLYHVAAVYTS